MNRREFLASVAAAGAVVSLGDLPMRAAEEKKARARVGLVGCGWYGNVVLQAMVEAADVEVISLCDPDRRALDRTLAALKGWGRPAARVFADYREMLKSGAPEVVIVSTPDHWHALPAIAAMEAGADVMMEKPVSHDVIEGEALVAAARKHGRVVQVNLQRRSTRCLAEARDKYIQSGKIGRVGSVEMFSFLSGRPRDVVEVTPPPAELDWDLWTGPAPMRPYRLSKSTKAWRSFTEYGNGQIGDLGVHMLDAVRWMLGLGWPTTISSNGGIYVDREATANISDTQRSVFHYPHLDVNWEHRTWGAPPFPARHWTDHWGARILGSNGTLLFNIVGYLFTPTDGSPPEGFSSLSKTSDWNNFDQSRFDSAIDVIQRDHVMNFLSARETRAKPVSDVEEGHISTASCILANLAQELGRPLRYDPSSRTVPGDEEATQRLRRSYRGPWVHPDPENV